MDKSMDSNQIEIVTSKNSDDADAGAADMPENLAWEEISREHIIQDQWIDFRRSDYRFPDGKVFGPFYSYSRRDYCIIVASDEEGRYLCVRQFRQGIRQVTTEFPAGGMSTCLEGVESEELQDYLRMYQATWFQGYYYSKPVEIGRLMELVRDFT